MIPGMSKRLRTDLAAMILSLCPVSLVAKFRLSFMYYSSRSPKPNPELGMIYPLNNHGSYVYLSNTESTGLSLLTILFAVSFFLTFFVTPKEWVPPSPETPRWITYVGARYRTDLGTARSMTIFVYSSAFWSILTYYGGQLIVNFIVSQGIVLKWY